MKSSHSRLFPLSDQAGTIGKTVLGHRSYSLL